MFKDKRLFRLFISFQLGGLVIIVFLQLFTMWSILGEKDFFFLDPWMMYRYKFESYLSLLCLFRPFPITKAIDWILSAKN